MEWFSADFLSALFAIIVIDLVLAGDNAVVIALAARNLPERLRNRAIVWGTFGAIAVRTAMTMAVVWLLRIPALLAVGGIVLVWIAYRLIADDAERDGRPPSPSRSFWGAMKTIIMADALMGLDNVLAVAGAARGSFLLVAIGLLASVPIVVWGSRLILAWIERYPAIVYLGAGVLAWTAVRMITAEPLLEEAVARHPRLVGAAYLVAVAGVLTGGFLANQGRTRARAAKRRLDLAAVTDPPPRQGSHP